MFNYFNIIGSFEYENESYNKIDCDKEMFEDLWSNLLYCAIIKEVNMEDKKLVIILQYKDESNYLEYYGDYTETDMSVVIDSDHIDLRENAILIYNKTEKRLQLKRNNWTQEERTAKEKEIKEMVKKFKKVFD